MPKEPSDKITPEELTPAAKEALKKAYQAGYELGKRMAFNRHRRENPLTDSPGKPMKTS